MSDAQVTIVGNATRDPELRFSKAGKPICTLGLAVNYKPRNGDESVSFIDVVCFDQMAENAAESITKGTRVVVSGRLQVRTYEKRDGGQGTSVEVVADEVAVSLRWATARAEKVSRGSVQGSVQDAGTRTYDESSEPW